MKYFSLSTPLFLLFFLSAVCFAQQEMSSKDCAAALDNGAKREQASKQGIAEAQASITTLKDQLKETEKQIEKNRAAMFSAAGITPDGLAQWQEKIAVFQSQADALAALPPDQLVSRQGELPGMEAQLGQLKQDRAMFIPASSVLMSAAETSLNNAKSAVEANAAAENQAKIDEANRKADEAKQAKLEVKQKAEADRQARIEAKRQATEEAKQKAEAERQAAPAAGSDESTAGLEDLAAGTTYRVKLVPENRQTLAKMAMKLWGDPKQWTRIYEANKEKIDQAFEEHKKKHPETKLDSAQNYLYPGEELAIPR